MPSDVTVRALTDCDVLAISRAAFEQATGQFPDLRARLQQSMEERMQMKPFLNLFGEEKIALIADYNGETEVPTSYEVNPKN